MPIKDGIPAAALAIAPVACCCTHCMPAGAGGCAGAGDTGARSTKRSAEDAALAAAAGGRICGVWVGTTGMPAVGAMNDMAADGPAGDASCDNKSCCAPAVAGNGDCGGGASWPSKSTLS